MRIMGSNSKMVRYKLNGEEAIKVFYDNKELDAIELIPYNPNSIFKIKTIKKDSDEINNTKLNFGFSNEIKTTKR